MERSTMEGSTREETAMATPGSHTACTNGIQGGNRVPARAGLPKGSGGSGASARPASANSCPQSIRGRELVHRTVDSPLGCLLLVASPAGLVRVAYSVEDHEDVLEELAALAAGGVGRAGAALDDPARQFEDYFAGRRNEFTLPVDLPEPPSTFGVQVLQTVQRVPYGAVATYTDIAALAGRPDSVRAVGAACTRNPLPIVVPCHRVVKMDGSLGHYVAGPAAKRWLLRLETLGPAR